MELNSVNHNNNITWKINSFPISIVCLQDLLSKDLKDENYRSLNLIQTTKDIPKILD
jgi:hypothetical protein